MREREYYSDSDLIFALLFAFIHIDNFKLYFISNFVCE